MSDWRLNGQEKYLSGVCLYKVTLPDFWEEAYRDKNAFYQKIVRDAEKFAAETNRGAEYLKGEKIKNFWHEHCEFCSDKATTNESVTFYCTEDMRCWICEECFRDFQKDFQWVEKTTKELLL